LTIELHDAFFEREKRIVSTTSDVEAGVKSGAALPDDDASGADALAAVDLDAQALAIRFAPVSDRALTFLVCHCYLGGVVFFGAGAAGASEALGFAGGTAVASGAFNVDAR
jgi:hypothetical protein